MFKSKTVFIVGAGASAEVGLPTGPELKVDIAQRLDISFKGGYQQDSGDRAIMAALSEYARNTTTNPNDYLTEGWRIRDAMPQALSIDNFIDAHSGNTKLELCGKLAIARSIMEAEANSTLYVDGGKLQTYDPKRVNENIWCRKFFQLLTENVRRSEIAGIFENISFVVFNYDRCIEQFLFEELRSYYGLSEPEVAALLAKLHIVHPYGSLGPLQWREGPPGVAFGGRSSGKSLLEVAKQIKTFTEREEDQNALAAIHLPFKDAQTVVFLGFGFHELNMQLLKSEPNQGIRRVYGTALGISNSDLRAVDADILATLQTNSLTALSLHNNIACAGLFNEHWRDLSRGV